VPLAARHKGFAKPISQLFRHPQDVHSLRPVVPRFNGVVHRLIHNKTLGQPDHSDRAGSSTWQALVVLVTTHVLSGAVLGALAPDLPTALTGGFISHFVLDAIPHWGCEPDEMLRVAVPDGLIGLAAIAAVATAAEPACRLRVLAGVFGACLPDIDKPAELFFGRSPFPWWFDRFHQVIQHERPHRWRREVTTAAAMAVLAATVLRAPQTPKSIMHKLFD
jgi:hypothetical protein